MNVRAVGMWGLAVVAVALCRWALAEPPAKQGAAASQPGQPARLGAAPPGTHGVPGTAPVLRPDQIEKRISPEEREKFGVPEPDWVAKSGKVHPDVRAILETGQMPWARFKGWEPIGFEGTAYVSVYLRYAKEAGHAAEERQPVVGELQKRVLSRLTAAEFHAWFLFQASPAILGFVDAEGLTKLAKDEDVVGVGLDDKPVPEGEPHAMGEAPAPGVPPSAKERRGNVEVPVYEALDKSPGGYVFVIVHVTRTPRRGRLSPEVRSAWEADVRKSQDRVLSALNADQFRLQSRSVGAFFAGCVDSAGLAVLATHADVRGVGLDSRVLLPADEIRTHP